MSAIVEKRVDRATSLVKSLEASYCAALPAHVTMEHFSRALLTEFRRTPALLECTRESIGAGVLLFAQLGLQVGVNGAGWLVPFNDRRNNCKNAVAIIGYQGLVDLCYRSDRVESICADVVCENDEFEFEQGLDQKLRHKPYLRGARGNPYAVYAIANIKGSARPVYVVLNADEIETVKNASKGAEKKDSPWNGSFEIEMWKKTAIRRLCKYLPKSVDLVAALEFENRQAEEMKEASATIVDDDPLAPGRHERKRQAMPQPTAAEVRQAEERREEMKAQVEQAIEQVEVEQEGQASEQTTEKSEPYKLLERLYDTHNKLVDETLAKLGLMPLPELDWKKLTKAQDALLRRAAAKVSKELSEAEDK